MSHKKLLRMKNFSLLRFDKSCGIFGCFYRDCYDYPIAYEDGLVSRFKSVAAGRKVWGFVLKGYVISVYPILDKTPAEAADYCQDKTFAGRSYCLVPLSVMNKVVRDIAGFNILIEHLGGKPLESRWYMAQNDKWLTPEWRLDERVYGVNPAFFDEGTASFIDKDMTAAFYPAVKI